MVVVAVAEAREILLDEASTTCVTLSTGRSTQAKSGILVVVVIAEARGIFFDEGLDCCFRDLEGLKLLSVSEPKQ